MIFVPVSCEHADNFDFHPGLTSPRSHVNGALELMGVDMGNYEIQSFLDFLV